MHAQTNNHPGKIIRIISKSDVKWVKNHYIFINNSTMNNVIHMERTILLRYLKIQLDIDFIEKKKTKNK